MGGEDDETTLETGGEDEETTLETSEELVFKLLKVTSSKPRAVAEGGGGAGAGVSCTNAGTGAKEQVK
jgi:hypothetical protein